MFNGILIRKKKYKQISLVLNKIKKCQFKNYEITTMIGLKGEISS
jgi:hypothetical protein